MNTLVVYAHPDPASYVAAVRDSVLASLRLAGHHVRLIDLYADGFDARMTAEERTEHHHPRAVRPDLDEYAHALRWAEAIVFVYPTWWAGQPAILKGWFDRVWTNEIAYRLVEGRRRPMPLLHNIRRLVVVTTHGSSKWVNAVEGEGGKRIVTRSLRAMCSRWTRTKWVALYDVDRATQVDLQRFLRRVANARLLR
jgi:putative NADPH-quinone reductase